MYLNACVGDVLLTPRRGAVKIQMLLRHLAKVPSQTQRRLSRASRRNVLHTSDKHREGTRLSSIVTWPQGLKAKCHHRDYTLPSSQVGSAHQRGRVPQARQPMVCDAEGVGDVQRRQLCAAPGRAHHRVGPAHLPRTSASQRRLRCSRHSRQQRTRAVRYFCTRRVATWHDVSFIPCATIPDACEDDGRSAGVRWSGAAPCAG